MTEQCKRKFEGIVELLDWIARGRNEFNLYNICCHLTSLQDPSDDRLLLLTLTT